MMTRKTTNTGLGLGPVLPVVRWRVPPGHPAQLKYAAPGPDKLRISRGLVGTCQSQVGMNLTLVPPLQGGLEGALDMLPLVVVNLSHQVMKRIFRSGHGREQSRQIINN